MKSRPCSSGLGVRGVALASSLAEMAVLVSRLARRAGSLRVVELHMTTDIVTCPPPCATLVNPTNNELCGTSLAYFPIGGPVPPRPPPGLTSTMWGGMDAGKGLLYREQVVDGHVTEHGGRELAAACRALPAVPGTDVRCPTGSAVVTRALGSLCHNFEHVVHTVPPFFSDEHWRALLSGCYHACFERAFRLSGAVACPLLGAGARGAPVGEAADVAAQATASWCAADDIALVPEAARRLKFALIDAAAHHAIERALVGHGFAEVQLEVQ